MLLAVPNNLEGAVNKIIYNLITVVTIGATTCLGFCSVATVAPTSQVTPSATS
jgi:hypothetical protein